MITENIIIQPDDNTNLIEIVKDYAIVHIHAEFKNNNRIMWDYHVIYSYTFNLLTWMLLADWKQERYLLELYGLKQKGTWTTVISRCMYLMYRDMGLNILPPTPQVWFGGIRAHSLGVRHGPFFCTHMLIGRYRDLLYIFVPRTGQLSSSQIIILIF